MASKTVLGKMFSCFCFSLFSFYSLCPIALRKKKKKRKSEEGFLTSKRPREKSCLLFVPFLSVLFKTSVSLVLSKDENKSFRINVNGFGDPNRIVGVIG